MTNIPTSPEIEETNPEKENPYTVRRARTDTRHLLRGRRRASLSFPTQDSTLVSYGSTDIESNVIRPLEAEQTEPPSRIGTPTLSNFSIASPSQSSRSYYTNTHIIRTSKLTHFYRQQHNKDKISILYKNTSVYNQYNHQIAHFGQQHHHNNQQVQVQHHEEHQEHPH